MTVLCTTIRETARVCKQSPFASLVQSSQGSGVVLHGMAPLGTPGLTISGKHVLFPDPEELREQLFDFYILDVRGLNASFVHQTLIAIEIVLSTAV